MYNEILVVPWLGFDKNIKKNIELRKRRGLLEEDEANNYDPGYIASPNQGYDAGRNYRKIKMKMENARLEGGLNKSEITVEETAHKSYISNRSTDPK